jgi:predicted Ser/Thr protein kinase
MKVRLQVTLPFEPPFTFEHAGATLAIGRDPKCDLAMQGEASQVVSWKHARIELEAKEAYLTDLQSTNGTYLNGQRLTGRAVLRNGDQIGLGQAGPKLQVMELDLTAAPAERPKSLEEPAAKSKRKRRGSTRRQLPASLAEAEQAAKYGTLAHSERDLPARELTPGTYAKPPSEVDTVPPPPAPAEDLGIPVNFGRYRIIKRLGKGAMGAVYLAQDTQLDRPVALKVPSFKADDSPTLLERFHREARVAATLQHPNLCPIHDVGQFNGVHYLTMAYIDGRSLQEVIRSGQAFTPRQIATLVHKLALGLAEAHQHTVVHRDLKPANIIINHRGEPIIIDFGLARRANKGDPQLTRAGAIVGTPAYMSPEQVLGEADIGPSADIYSLGVILYQLLTGRVPYKGEVWEVLANLLTKDAPPPSTVRPDVDPALDAICRKAMGRKPSDRYPAMSDMAEALADYLNPHEKTTF